MDLDSSIERVINYSEPTYDRPVTEFVPDIKAQSGAEEAERFAAALSVIADGTMAAVVAAGLEAKDRRERRKSMKRGRLSALKRFIGFLRGKRAKI